MKVTKLLSALLAILMLVAVVPANAFAAIDFVDSSDGYYKVISKLDFELAPGITESEIVLNTATLSHRQVAHVVEVDMSNPYTKVIPSYKGMIPTEGKYGVQVMSEQAKWAEANGYGNVVAAMNISLSWYDSQYYKDNPHLYGEPLGYMILDGVMYENTQHNFTDDVEYDPKNPSASNGGAQTCVVINFDSKDGVARPEDMPKVEIRDIKSPITGWEEQVIPANFGYLVKDGKNAATKVDHTGDAAPRSFVGIKADGTFVMVMNDGRQAPFSKGFTSYEMGEFMLSLGCVVAINGDGGGSSTYLSQRPGEELKLNCSPSDGSERPTTHGILVISTAPSNDKFERATISSEYDYYLPNHTVNFKAIGTNLIGEAKEIPEGAMWQLADASMGEITQEGVFTSNGKLGEVKVQMVYEEAVVGEHTINIVMPDKLYFRQAKMIIPFNKTVDLALSASYQYKDVCVKPSDVTFTLSDPAIGTINGFDFTSGEEGIAATSSTLTATIGTLSTTAELALGKASKIVYDFEDQNIENLIFKTGYPQYGPSGSKKDENGNYYYNGQNEMGSLNVVNAANGMVRNGNFALAALCDFTQIYETGYHAMVLTFKEAIDFTDALAVGMWIYIPYDARHLQIEFAAGGSYVNVYDNGELFNLKEGWHYIKLDVSEIATKKFTSIRFGIDDRACSSKDKYYDYITDGNTNGKYTLYIDDITVDYSMAVEDRENPVFTLPSINVSGAVSLLEGQTINLGNVSFETTVKDNQNGSNITGINGKTAKAFIDGKEIECTYFAGKLSTANVSLADGYHNVKFYIEDYAGNSSWVEGNINVATGKESSTIKVVPADPSADRILIGSLYWMDVIATNIETINKVEMVFDLNNASKWELAGMEVAEGFVASYAIQEDDNIATIIIERTEYTEAKGEAKLLSFPVRTWVSTITECEGYEDQTPAKLVSRGIIWKQDIEIYLEKGIITYIPYYKSGTTGTFDMEDIDVDTEIFFTNYSRASVAGAQEWINAKKAAGLGWHEHTNVTTFEDVPATCTKPGIVGKTYCEDCKSFVDFGFAPATGHSYEVTEDGLYHCDTCDEARYYVNGEYVTGWNKFDGKTYYFDKDGIAANGTYTVDGHTYGFVDYVLTTPSWEKDGEYLTAYWAGTIVNGGWYTFNGNKYFFTGIYANTGVAKVALSTNLGWRFYVFDENGVWQESKTGIVEYAGDIYYAENGVCTYAGVVPAEITNEDGSTTTVYYYINSTYKAVKACFYSIGEKKTNGYIPAGVYEITVEGHIIVPERPDYEDGVHKLENGDIIYTVAGEPTYAGLVEYTDEAGEKHFVYINSSKKAVKACKYGITKSKLNGHDVKPGVYEFDENGYMIIPEESKLPDGVHKLENGDIVYIINGVAVYAGVAEYTDEAGEKHLVYINSSKKAVKGCKYGITASKINGFDLKPGVYEITAEGYIVIPEEIKDGINGDLNDKDAVIRYYQNGVPVYYGLYAHSEEGSAEVVYYYFNSSKTAVKNCKYGISKSKLNGYDIKPGVYEFDEFGRMKVNEEEAKKQGFTRDPDGEIRFYENGVAIYKGLVEDPKNPGDFYYINSTKKAVKDCVYGITAAKLNGYDAEPYNIQAGVYVISPEGIIQFPDVKKGLTWDDDGEIRYYVNGEPTYAGVVAHTLTDENGEAILDENGEETVVYYYINSSKKAVKACVYGISEARTNGLIPAGVYKIGNDGVIQLNETENANKNGIIEENGVKYYYENGIKTYKGVFVVDGNYYFANVSGIVVSNCYYSVSEAKTNGLVKKGVYKFDVDGKMIDPIVIE